MNWKDYIVTDPDILNGKPIIKGTRLTVESIVEKIASGWSEDDLLENYSQLKKEDLQAVFLYIKDNSAAK